MTTQFQSRPRRRGSLLIEVSLAMGLTAMLAMLLMRASLLAISGNQWSIMQTLTDAYLTRETALANRIPFADVAGDASAWPALSDEAGSPGVNEQTIVMGRLPGGVAVQGLLKRFRTPETEPADELSQTVWRLHSVLAYNIGEERYVKTRSVLRVQ